MPKQIKIMTYVDAFFAIFPIFIWIFQSNTADLNAKSHINLPGLSVVINDGHFLDKSSHRDSEFTTHMFSQENSSVSLKQAITAANVLSTITHQGSNISDLKFSEKRSKRPSTFLPPHHYNTDWLDNFNLWLSCECTAHPPVKGSRCLLGVKRGEAFCWNTVQLFASFFRVSESLAGGVPYGGGGCCSYVLYIRYIYWKMMSRRLTEEEELLSFLD